MSYCRLGDDCDVYVIYSTGGTFDCVWCCNNKEETISMKMLSEMISHLKAHKLKGNKVPDRVLNELIDDDERPIKRLGDKLW